MGRNPNCACWCRKQFNIQKLDTGNGTILWQRAVPLEDTDKTHNLFEIHTCSDGSFVVYDAEFPFHTGLEFRGNRRINSSATDTIATAPNLSGDPNATGNTNTLLFKYMAIRPLFKRDSDPDIRDIVITTFGPDVMCNYCSDMTRKWKHSFGSETSHNVVYCGWNDKIVVAEQSSGYTRILSDLDGSEVTSWRTPRSEFAGGYLIGQAILDAGPAGVLYMASRAMYLTDWSGNMLFYHGFISPGIVASWMVGCLSNDGNFIYMSNNVELWKFRISDQSVIWKRPVSRFTETGVSGYTAALAYQIVENPANGYVCIAGEAMLHPITDNDPQFDHSGFLIDYEFKNVICYDANGYLIWTRKEDMEGDSGATGTPNFLQRTGLTVSADNHFVVTSYLFTPF